MFALQHKLIAKGNHAASGGAFTQIGVNGCQFDPYADEYTRSKPKKTDLVGTYVLTGQTLTNTPIGQLKAQNGSNPSPHKLILRSDGTFSTLNMPLWVGNWANGSSDEWSISKFKSGSGKWDVQVVGGVGDGSGKVVDVWGLDFSSANISMGSVTLSREKPPYSIIFGYGDPDGGDDLRKANRRFKLNQSQQNKALHSTAYSLRSLLTPASGGG